MRKLKLIPLKNDMVEERVASFRQYNDEVTNSSVMYPGSIGPLHIISFLKNSIILMLY